MLPTLASILDPEADAHSTYDCPSTSAAPLIAKKLVANEALNNPPPSRGELRSEVLELRQTARLSLRVMLGQTMGRAGRISAYNISGLRKREWSKCLKLCLLAKLYNGDFADHPSFDLPWRLISCLLITVLSA